MQDDSPWKPPSDDSEADRSGHDGVEEVLDEPIASEPEPQSTTETPTLPDAPRAAPVASDGPTLPDSSSNLPPTAPTLEPPPVAGAPWNPAETRTTQPAAVVSDPDDTVVVRSE
ncbi:MAG: hypothetical protein WKF60_10615, partial [Ilumatobacter sp.]